MKGRKVGASINDSDQSLGEVKRRGGGLENTENL